MSIRSRAIRISSHGAPEVLRAEEIEVPDPGENEVRIRQTAVGLNFQDCYHRSGFYPLPMPSGIGTEAAGAVEKVGPGVSGFAVGDRVCYAGGSPGAYAQLRVMPIERLLRTPEGVSDEQAAAALLKGMTVEYLLNRCVALKSGQFALMYAACGGVGLLAGQWGRHLGIRMIGVASGADKAAEAKQAGYEFVIDRQKEDVAARVKEITAGQGVPAVYDSVGKATFETSLKSLAPRGYFVSFGTTTGAPPPVEASALQKLGSLYFTRPTLVTYTASRSDLEASSNALFDLLRRGVLKVSIKQRYPMDQAVRAHLDLEAGRTHGSSVLLP